MDQLPLLPLRLRDDNQPPCAFSERKRGLTEDFTPVLSIFSFLFIKHILLFDAFVFWKRVTHDLSKRLSQLPQSSEFSV